VLDTGSARTHFACGSLEGDFFLLQSGSKAARPQENNNYSALPQAKTAFCGITA
jgi:hypothetical protein